MTNFDVTIWRKRKIGKLGEEEFNSNSLRQKYLESCINGKYLGLRYSFHGDLGSWIGHVFRFNKEENALNFSEKFKNENNSPPKDKFVWNYSSNNNNIKKSKKQKAKELRKKEWENKRK